ncbi:hypothetical protein ZHAS_00004748 [Anopheles sinensis]|uniref:Uncharacterized protein n=1 Tax=Anopheles sinensis TaxID=74873 RepID=A0A084VHS1_ANOSI|nr:hypothetical protein ZHAS_00004748 [Anopheles sinensis]
MAKKLGCADGVCCPKGTVNVRTFLAVNVRTVLRTMMPCSERRKPGVEDEAAGFNPFTFTVWDQHNTVALQRHIGQETEINMGEWRCNAV